MYMNGDTQRNVLNRLHFALAPQGVLFLGHAEMMLSQGDRFSPVSLDSRVFRKALGIAHAAATDSTRPPRWSGTAISAGLDPIRELAFRASPVAQIVVTGEDTVAMINQQAETTFGLSARDIGRLLRDLEVSYRPLELRSYLEQAKVERRVGPRPGRQVACAPGAEPPWYEVHINPLVDADNGLLGVSVVFFDVTANRQLLDKVVQTNQQLEAAYEELQSTNEELETTNEELQSTVEELETTNEELQSTNEELETMNEELQSTNDELHTINDALRDRSIELDEAKIVPRLAGELDPASAWWWWTGRCGSWCGTAAAEELWGLRSDETIGVAADRRSTWACPWTESNR